MRPRIERTVSQRKNNEKIFYWFEISLSEIRAISIISVGLITIGKSDVDIFERERSMISMNSSCIRIKDDLVKKIYKMSVAFLKPVSIFGLELLYVFYKQRPV